MYAHPPRMAPTPGCSFRVRAAMVYNGKKYAAGDPFPFKSLGMTEDGAWNLWRAAMLTVDEAPKSKR